MSTKAKRKKIKVSPKQKMKKTRKLSVKSEESGINGAAGRALRPRNAVVVYRETDTVEDSRNERKREDGDLPLDAVAETD